MESKFLDDKLYHHTMNRSIKNADEFKDLLNELFRICEDHWKPQVNMTTTTNKEVKVLLDRAFNCWDLFVKKLIKEEWYLSGGILPYSYKEVFMLNENLKKTYDNL